MVQDGYIVRILNWFSLVQLRWYRDIQTTWQWNPTCGRISAALCTAVSRLIGTKMIIDYILLETTLTLYLLMAWHLKDLIQHVFQNLKHTSSRCLLQENSIIQHFIVLLMMRIAYQTAHRQNAIVDVLAGVTAGQLFSKVHKLADVTFVVLSRVHCPFFSVLQSQSGNGSCFYYISSHSLPITHFARYTCRLYITACFLSSFPGSRFFIPKMTES